MFANFLAIFFMHNYFIKKLFCGQFRMSHNETNKRINKNKTTSPSPVVHACPLPPTSATPLRTSPSNTTKTVVRTTTTTVVSHRHQSPLWSPFQPQPTHLPCRNSKLIWTLVFYLLFAPQIGAIFSEKVSIPYSMVSSRSFSLS